ncbi:UNVERIFIED_CONTAM: hypothetical protein NCL1_44749 [Trichonephila clavipes]
MTIIFFPALRLLGKAPVMVCVIDSRARIIQPSCANFCYRISDSDCLSQNMPGATFSCFKAFKVRPCQGVSKIRWSGIIQQSCDNFLYRISDSDCPFPNTPWTSFKVKPCQEVPKIRSSSIVRQSYGYFGDLIRNLNSTPLNIPGTDFSCTLVHKIRFPDTHAFRHLANFPVSRILRIFGNKK